jgi:hypothetical protein
MECGIKADSENGFALENYNISRRKAFTDIQPKPQ